MSEFENKSTSSVQPPKPSLRENAIMTAKVLGICAAVMLLLLLVDVWVAG